MQLEEPAKKRLTHKTSFSLTNDIELLPTREILRRLYKRHAIGVWQFSTILTLIVAITLQVRR
jgi:hypothetical protein